MKKLKAKKLIYTMKKKSDILASKLLNYFKLSMYDNL